MKKIHILELETGNEAHALRAAAECWGVDVSMTWVGNSAQIVDYLSSRPQHELIIISGHGDSSGLLLPELDKSVAHLYPYDKRISPEQFLEFLKLDGSPVLNLSCETGQDSFAQAFLTCGATRYIGPADSPDMSASLMYVLLFLYAFIVNGASVTEAHKSAVSEADDRSMFRIWENRTTHGTVRRTAAR